MAQRMTGYPSIDKPWLKYYSEEAINAPLPEMTMFQYIPNFAIVYTPNIYAIYNRSKITCFRA